MSTVAVPPTGGVRLIKEALLTSGASVASAVLSAGASVIMARELGVELRGVSSALLALAVLFGTFGTLGLPAAGAFALARTPLADRPRVTQAMLLFGVLFALVSAAACIVTALATQPPGIAASAYWATGGVAAALVMQTLVLQLVLTGASVRWYGAMQVFPAVAVLLVVEASALLDQLDVARAIEASVAGSVCTVGLGTLALARHGALGRRRAVATWDELSRTVRPHVGYAITIFFITSLAQVIQRLDLVLVQGFSGSRAAGLYAVAGQLANFVLIVPAALGALVFRRGARSDPGHWADAMRALRLTTVAAIGAAAILALGASTLIRLLVGQQYLGGVTPLRLLLPGVVLLGVQSVISNYIASRDRARTVLTAWLTTALVGVILDVIFIPIGGITAAAIVSSLSYLLVLGLHIRALRALRPSATKPQEQSPERHP